MQRRKWIAWLLIAVSCFCLAACRVNSASNSTDTEVPIGLEQEDVYENTETLVLYYPSTTDPERLYAENRSIDASSTNTLVNVAVEELLKGPQHTDLFAVIPRTVRLIMTEQSGQIVTVHLSSEILSLSDRELLLAKISIINTLTSINGVEYVTLMCDEKEITVMGYASGAEGMFVGTLDEKIDQYRQAMESGANSRKITLYFQNRSGEYLIPEIRTIENRSDLAETIINELIAGPSDTSRSYAVMRPQMHLIETPILTDTSDGSMLLIVNLTGDDTFLSESSGQLMMRVGAIVLSLASNMPDVDYVSVQIDSLSINRYVAGRSGYLHASMFRNLVGNTMHLYYPNETGTHLVEVERMVDQSSVGVARDTLTELFRGPQEMESPDAVPLPVMLSDSDVLSLQIQNGQVTVNLKKDAVDMIFALDHDTQYTCIYAIVNSLCGLQGINRVAFLANGETITSGGVVSMEGALMPNIGLAR